MAIGLKCVILFAFGTIEWSNIKATLPAKLQEKLNPNYAEQKDEPL